MPRDTTARPIRLLQTSWPTFFAAAVLTRKKEACITITPQLPPSAGKWRRSDSPSTTITKRPSVMTTKRPQLLAPHANTCNITPTFDTASLLPWKGGPTRFTPKWVSRLCRKECVADPTFTRHNTTMGPKYVEWPLPASIIVSTKSTNSTFAAIGVIPRHFYENSFTFAMSRFTSLLTSTQLVTPNSTCRFRWRTSPYFREATFFNTSWTKAMHTDKTRDCLLPCGK